MQFDEQTNKEAERLVAEILSIGQQHEEWANLQIRGAQDPQALDDIITLSNSHLRLLIADTHVEEFWASEADIEMGSSTYNYLCKALGYDINDEGVFSSFYLKATAIEIAAANHVLLLEIQRLSKS